MSETKLSENYADITAGIMPDNAGDIDFDKF